MQLLESIRWTPQWRPISSNIVLYCVQRLICIYSWNTLLFAWYFLVNKYHIYTERNQVVSRVTPCYLQHPNCIVFKKVLNEKETDEHMQTYLCHTEAISKSSRQLIMFLCIFSLLFLISFHWWFTIMYYFYVYSKYVFMSLTDIPLYLVLYTFGTYLYFVFVYMDVVLFLFWLFLYTKPHSLVFW